MAGVVVTADALHAQRSGAQYLHERGADYVLTVESNQPALHRQLRSLLWGQAPVGRRQEERARGKITIRTTKTVMIEADIDFPHDAQAVQITRRAGTGPRVMTSLRNLALSLHRMTGATNIAQVTRRTARDPQRALNLIGLAP